MNTDLTTNKQRGKQINWNDLFTKNAAQLKGLCRRYVGDDVIAEDIVQESFITAIEKIDTFSGKGSIEGWIRKIAINKALLCIRERQNTHLPINDSMNPTEQDMEMEYSASTTRHAIENASFSTVELMSVIDSLPEHHKTVFNMYVIDGFSHQQISEMMNITTNTSKSHLLRARKKAQELLLKKALTDHKYEKKQRSLFLLLFFSPNYIDKIFRKGFKNYTLPIQAPTQIFPTSTVQALKWTSTLMGKIVMYGIVAPSASIAVIAGYMNLTKQNEANSSSNYNHPTEIITLFDSTQIQSINNTTTLSNDSVASRMKDTTSYPSKDTISCSTIPKSKVKPKLVNKKQVIIKKTIIVHDTIRLEKPTTK